MAPASGERWDASTEVPSERGFAAWPQTAHHVSWRGVDHEGRNEHHSAGQVDTEALTQHLERPPGMSGQQAALRGSESDALTLQPANSTRSHARVSARSSAFEVSARSPSTHIALEPASGWVRVVVCLPSMFFPGCLRLLRLPEVA